MAFERKDRVKDTTTTTGTGTVTLTGTAPSGYRSVSAAHTDGATVRYAISMGAEWEVGEGVYTASGTTLSRALVLASSNAGALVNFSAGTKTVITTLTAGEVDGLVKGPASATADSLARFDGTTGKLLKDGAVIGTDVASLAANTFTDDQTINTGNLSLDVTTFGNQKGIITKDGTRFVHNFNYGNNGTVTTVGNNTCVGLSAGNLSMGSTATLTYHASYNSFIGAYSGYYNTTGSSNSFIGAYSGYNNTTGSGNSFIGVNAGYANTTGDSNFFLGTYAGYANTTGYSNSFIGASAGQNNTTGYNNSFIGTSAGQNNTTGYSNSFIGVYAGQNNTTGYSNSFIGKNTGYANTTGYNNSFIGVEAGYNSGITVTAGSFVVGVSYTIITSGTTDFTTIGAADSNPGTVFTATGVGSGTGTAASNTNYNTFVGESCGYDVLTGGNNSMFGRNTGRGITTGTGNTILGAGITGLSAGLTNNIILASGSTARATFNATDWRFAAPVGYATGQGGVVTQITSRTTGVTLNKSCGEITLVSAAGTAAWQTFTVTNSVVAATDTIIVNQKSGTDLNMIHVTAVAAGSFNISFATTGGTTTEQPVFNFAIIKGVTS